MILQQIRLLLHLLPGRVGIEQRGVDVGVPCLICHLVDAVPASMAAEQ